MRTGDSLAGRGDAGVGGADPGERARWRPTLRLRLNLLIGAFFAVILALGGVALLSIVQRDDAFARMVTTLEPARDAANRYVAGYIDQETGVRGFVITRSERSLDPYVAGRSAADRSLAELRELLAGEEDLLDIVETMADAGARWRTEAAEPAVAAVRAGRPGEAVGIEATGAGRERFEEMRSEVRRLRAALLAEQSAEIEVLDRARRRLSAVVLGAMPLGVLLLALAARLLRIWISDPLDALVRSVRRVAAGALYEPIPAVGPPEVAELGARVGDMRSRIISELDRAVRAREALAQQGLAVLALRAELEPSLPPSLPALVAAGRFAPAEGMLAGDWYDFVAIGEGEVALLMVDVAGHGAAAGVLALRAKQLLLAALDQGLQPGDALGWLASQLGDTGESFMTCIVLVIEPRSGACRYANAGHPPLLVATTSDLSAVHPTGPLLGPLPGRWETEKIALDRQSLAVAYTDGVIEARDGDGREFGSDRLRDLVRAQAPYGPGALVDACVEAVTMHSQGRLADDITVVALQRQAPGVDDAIVE